MGIRPRARPLRGSSPGEAATRPTTMSKTVKKTQPAKSFRSRRMKKSRPRFTAKGATAITPKARPIQSVAKPGPNGVLRERACSTTAPTTETPPAIGTISSSRVRALRPSTDRDRNRIQANPPSANRAATWGPPEKSPPAKGAKAAANAPGRNPRHASPMTSPGNGSHNNPPGPPKRGPRRK